MPLAVAALRTDDNRQDLDLLKRIQRRDNRALALLYDRTAPVLYALTLRIIPSPQEAEDTLQDVYLQVWERASTYTPRQGSVYAWLAGLCRTIALDRVRTKNLRQRAKESQAVQSAETQPLVMKAYAESVREALKSISKLELKLLEMSYYEAHSQSEIARLLKLPLGTVKAKMRKGIQKLRQVAHGEKQ